MDRFDEIKELETMFETPFYLLNEENLLETYDEIDNAFRNKYDKFIIGYSYKTNYIPYICNLIKEKGGYAEVVSRLEYELALRVGQNPYKIIFNGPIKRYEDLELAIRNESIVNIDSWYELEHVKEIAKQYKNKTIKIGLRVNLKFPDKEGVSHIQEGLAVGRFGFPIESAGIAEAIALFRDIPNVKINCLHGHTSTTSRSVWIYEKITRTLCDLAAEHLSDSVEYIDIGGGIYGKIPPELSVGNTPTFEHYAEAICGVMNDHPWVRKKNPYLILEPGVAMVANALAFVTKVIDIKNIEGTKFAVVDGSIYNIKPNMHNKNHPFEILKRKNNTTKNTYNVVGYTCMEKDYLLKGINTCEIEKGDYIKIENVGAYTIVLTPPFINSAPPILLRKNSNNHIIRNRQTFEDFFTNYSFN